MCLSRKGYNQTSFASLYPALPHDKQELPLIQVQTVDKRGRGPLMDGNP